MERRRAEEFDSDMLFFFSLSSLSKCVSELSSHDEAIGAASVRSHALNSLGLNQVKLMFLVITRCLCVNSLGKKEDARDARIKPVLRSFVRSSAVLCCSSCWG